MKKNINAMMVLRDEILALIRVCTEQRTELESYHVELRMLVKEIKLLTYVYNTYSVPNAKEILLDLHTRSASSLSKKMSMIR